MKILLTGASGFLGKTLYTELSKSGQIETIGRKAWNKYQVDLSSQIPVLENSFDLVIHCAGKAHIIPKTQEEVQAFFDVNVTGTANLLKGLKQANVLPKSFVLISTVAVYGKDTGSNINEETPLLATDPYGKSKIEAEQLISTWCIEHKVTSAILRLPLIAGRNPPGNLGAMVNGIQKGYYFNIGEGNARKSVVMASDVAKIIPQAANCGGVFNLTDGIHPTFAEIANMIAAQMGKKSPRSLPLYLARFISKVGDLFGSRAPINTYKLNKITSDLTFDDLRAREKLDWNPEPVLKSFRIS